MTSTDIFSEILKAIKSGQPKLLQYPDLAPEDSAFVLGSLLDSEDDFEDYRFR